MRNKLLHMDMLEALRRGSGELLYFEEDGVLLFEKNSGAYMFTTKNRESGEKILSYNPLEMKWSSYPTEDENKMQKEIESVYDDAYYTARAEIESRKAAEDIINISEPIFSATV